MLIQFVNEEGKTLGSAIEVPHVGGPSAYRCTRKICSRRQEVEPCTKRYEVEHWTRRYELELCTRRQEVEH